MALPDSIPGTLANSATPSQSLVELASSRPILSACRLGIPGGRPFHMIDTYTRSNNDNHRMAALANAAMFNEEGTAHCVSASPHLTHPMVRDLYAKLVTRAFNTAKK